ncbi:hypothetical protein E2N91_11240 [Pseudomonas syringae pv. tomato]|uniref:hypothetical protein n=1 Tax=Pseudomonas syringae group genomosp. 3 TaxID=251701 RepID=UPI001067AF23|nr:hypothetical protein [Pseudomonas syringae group genomosp. 3]TES59163.1 hypothetical protein E2N91_11240 [Pseudomonas syringae pv. tomato]
MSILPSGVVLHIHSPKGVYIAQVRRLFERRWTQVGGDFKEKHRAQGAAAQNMVGDFKRARVLFCAEWYDPIVVMEASV